MRWWYADNPRSTGETVAPFKPFFIPMDNPIHIDIISMELPILSFKGFCVNITIDINTMWCISVPEKYHSLANSADPDDMPPYAAFCLGLHCLPKTKYLFTSIQDFKG